MLNLVDMEISIVKIKKIVDGLIDWVRQDLIAFQSTPNLSWLYLEFGDTTIEGVNFYQQLKSLIELGVDDQRRLETRLMFDRERANLPTIHIHYPNEEGKSGDNTLNTGFIETVPVNDTDVPLYSRSFIGEYELIITGGNSLEVVMLYEFLDGLLIAGADTLAYNFDKFEFGGKQLAANQDLIPYLIFYRAIGLSLQRKKIVHAITSRKRVSSVEFEGHFYTEGQEPPLNQASVSVVASGTNVPVNTTVTLAATPVNGGDNPVYNWYVDNVLVDDIHGNEFEVLMSDAGAYNIVCELISSIKYLNPSTVQSPTIVITVS